MATPAEEEPATGGDLYETIGLLGGRSAQERYGITRATKVARLREILSIARHYDILHGITPIMLRRLLEELGPTFVKAGQILSMRSEILPESFCNELAKLRTNVEPMDRDLLLATLRAEYETPIEDIFDAIDDVPLGSASVAQVNDRTCRRSWRRTYPSCARWPSMPRA